MDVSASALQALLRMEGAIPYVYDDGDGTWPKRRISSFSTKGYPTIGVGHRIYPSEQERFKQNLKGGRDLSTDEMMALLQEDIDERIATPSFRERLLVPITQSMWDALVTQAFNTGPNANSVKTAIFHINKKDWAGAQAALANGPVTSKGKTLDALVRRRAYEANLFMQDGEPGLMTGGLETWQKFTLVSITSLLTTWAFYRLYLSLRRD